MEENRTPNEERMRILRETLAKKYAQFYREGKLKANGAKEKPKDITN